MKVTKKFIYIFLFFVGSFLLAQEADTEFGKNRVQYKKFDWKSISSKNFTVYYYSGGNEIAHNALRYAEMDYQYICNTIGYIPRSKMTLIVYNSIGDIQQSNIGVKTDNYLGGETNFVKSKIEIAFPGTQVGFRKEIRFKISKMLLNYMMFGGNLKEVVQSNYMMNLPSWFIDGAASHVAQKHSYEVNDFMYHFIHQRNPDPSRLSGRDAELAGQAFWDYAADEYGKSIVPNLVNLTRITHDEKVSMITTLNEPYKVIIKNWIAYYHNLLGEGEFRDEHERNTFIDFYRYELKHFEFNPDTSLVAYSYHSQGKQKIVIKDTVTGKKKSLFVNHFKVIDQVTQLETPLIRWKSKTELSYVTYKKGKPFFVTYDVKKGKILKKQFDYLDQILSFDHSPLNEDEIVVSAVQKGQSDIFVYNFKQNLALRVTKDLYDDLSPNYLPNSSKIIFSSNRYIDTLELDPGSFDRIRDSFDLFILTQGSLVMERVTRSIHSEFKTIPLSDSTFLSLSLIDNRLNTCYINRNSGLVTQVSSFSPSCRDISLADGELGIVRRSKRENKVYYEPLRLDTAYASYFRMTKEKVKDAKLEDHKMRYEEAMNFLLTVDLDKISFDSTKIDSANTNLYSKLRDMEKVDLEKIFIYGPDKYRPSLSLDNFVSSAIIDPLRGLGVYMDANMSEMFGNHQFSGDFMLATDLKSNKISLDYDYLQLRPDFNISFDREDLNIAGFVRYGLTTAGFSASYPINQVSRFYSSASYTTTGISNLVSITSNDTYSHYVGADVGFVFDNTSIYGLNMMHGTRAKFYVRQMANMGVDNNFGEMRADVRHYQKIVDELTLAVRGSYGKYFGAGAKSYILGGMDNWFLGQTDGLEDAPLDFNTISENVLFLDYVTGLRGFNYNKLNGQQHLLMNAELRVPIARLIKNKPIQSKFYKSLQLVTFYDLGTAWNEGNIFSRANDRSTQEIDASPFLINVTNYTSPFIASYGMGLRTMMLGYYMKIDLAWGVENYNVNTPKLHVTLGYDF